MYDVIILGGGPAGLTAGIYCGRAGLKTLLIEEMFPGGQAATTFHIENYPGFPDGVDGPNLMNAFVKQAKNFGVEIKTEKIASLDLVKKSVNAYNAKALILAMGAKNRKLGLVNEEKLTGRGVSYCATCDGNFFRGMDVAVIGGGDTALEDALYLSKICNKIYLIHRRDSFRANKHLQDMVSALPNIELVLNSTVSEIKEADGRVGAVVVHDKEIPVKGVFVAVGTLPQTELVKDALELENGYIAVDNTMQTSIPGVFAAGDVTNTVLKQIITAAADGAKAAASAEKYISEQHL